MPFVDRHDAGRRLAAKLKEYQNDPNAVVIALPRGGVIVGYEVAQALHLPLDIVSPRKISAPYNPELAIGAITETGEGILEEHLINELGISNEFVTQAIEKEKRIAKERLNHYRKERLKREVKNKTVLIIDDGIATGSTMRAAIKTIKAEGAAFIVVAVPVGPTETEARLENEIQKLIILETPAMFYAVGQYYDHFEQTSDEEVVELLRQTF